MSRRSVLKKQKNRKAELSPLGREEWEDTRGGGGGEMRSVGDVFGRFGGGAAVPLWPCLSVRLPVCISLVFCCGIFSPSGNGSR